MTDRDDGAETFENNRHHLFGVAYRMLGRVTEAEDAVQDTWLRWAAADRDRIDNPTAWLTTVVSRLTLDILRSAQHRRETYVGPWLPEPLVTFDDDPAAHAELAETLSLAFLSMLERLGPVERAAFLLREVFRHDYEEIASMIDRSEVACRQIVHRAKERLGPDRPVRFDPGPDEERRLIDSFLLAAFAGDLDGLHAVLAEDVVALSDGGAEQRAARHPILGRQRVALLIRGIARQLQQSATTFDVHHVRVNGDPGIVTIIDGELTLTMAFELAPSGIQTVRTMLNPQKLDHLRDSAPGRG